MAISPDPHRQRVNPKLRGVSDFLLIIRDRWLLSVALSLPVSLAYVFVQQQVPERFQSSSSFSLTPPPAILNLQSVERESHLEGLIAKHTEGLNSQQLRANVIQRLEIKSELADVLRAPDLREGVRVGLGSTFSYTITQSGTKSRPRFIITTDARSAKGAKIIADLEQQEYEKLHRSSKSEKVEFVKQTLEDLS